MNARVVLLLFRMVVATAVASLEAVLLPLLKVPCDSVDLFLS